MVKENTIHTFKVPAIDGGEIDFSAFKGKKVLVVNTASDCEFTTQYRQLQELYTSFNNNLVVVGFPSNNFGEQEPGTNKEIRNFCSYRYGVTFPLAAKSEVTGSAINPVFKWLKEQELDGDLNKSITWNFQKFLLNEDGELIAVFPPSVDPINDELLGFLNLN